MSATPTFARCPTCGIVVKLRGVPAYCCGGMISGDPRPAQPDWLACEDRGEVAGSAPCRTCGNGVGTVPLYRCQRFDELVAIRQPGDVPGKEPWRGRTCVACIGEEDA